MDITAVATSVNVQQSMMVALGDSSPNVAGRTRLIHRGALEFGHGGNSEKTRLSQG